MAPPLRNSIQHPQFASTPSNHTLVSEDLYKLFDKSKIPNNEKMEVNTGNEKMEIETNDGRSSRYEGMKRKRKKLR